MATPFDILERKREGRSLTATEISDVVRGATDGSWTDAQLAAFLMAAYLRGLDGEETRALTLAMLRSGAQWELATDVPGVVDKHSTGGVGDKTSLILSPILAATGVPVAMLTGRALGHTGGTADKLESIPGLDLALDRPKILSLLSEVGMATGMATADIAPADRRLYGLRDHTATVSSLALITGSILSKKLATGTAAIVFDVKTGDGAFMREMDDSVRLAQLLVDTCEALGQRSSALITDMSQPLGRWVGHFSEVKETLACLEGKGAEDLMELVFALCEEAARLSGQPRSRQDLERVVADGSARETFDRWALAQGADPGWIRNPLLPLAPVEYSLAAPRSGTLIRVSNRRLGLLLVEAGAGRMRPGEPIDFGVSLRYGCRLGREVEAGEELARIYLRQADEDLRDRFLDCFEIGEGDSRTAPTLIRQRIEPKIG